MQAKLATAEWLLVLFEFSTGVTAWRCIKTSILNVSSVTDVETNAANADSILMTTTIMV